MVLFDQICTKAQDMRLAPLSQHVLKIFFFLGRGFFNLSGCIHTLKVPRVQEAPPLFFLNIWRRPSHLDLHFPQVDYVMSLSCRPRTWLAFASRLYTCLRDRICCECVKWVVCLWLAWTDFPCGIFTQVKVQDLKIMTVVLFSVRRQTARDRSLKDSGWCSST